MPDALSSSVQSHAGLELSIILVRLLLSVFCGLFIATVYRVSHGREKYLDNQAMFATLVLLCIFIAMVSMVIGNSVAMAFSLVGALSIVRFRTVVEDTRDTAFVIFTVITGMAMGAGYYSVPAIGVPLASSVAIALHHWNVRFSPEAKDGGTPWMLLTLRIAIGKDLNVLLNRVCENTVEKNLVSTSTTKQGTAIEVVYRVKLPINADPIEFVSTANLIDGMQSVELKSFS